MLIVSELAEAADGLHGDLKDDKLPHLPMFDVELADTAIRLYDLIGADAAGLPFDPNMVDRTAARFRDASTQEALMLLVGGVASAMEGHRKGDIERYRCELQDTLMAVYGLAKKSGIDLDDIIAQKRAFNATRSDHKIESRQQPGGKAY